jgi:hypothetical protein
MSETTDTIRNISTLADLDHYEDQIIECFQKHPCLDNLASLSQANFVGLLLQRRFLSLAFTPIYDMAIDGLLTNPKAQQSARRILREEYPGADGTEPSHRENLIHDLKQIGLTHYQIMNAVPSSATFKTIQRTLAFFTGDPDTLDYQIKLITLLRFWGEVLISAEYKMLWSRLESMGLQKNGKSQSRFYYPHIVHDAKRRPMDQYSIVNATTHPDQLALSLQDLLDNKKEAIAYCAAIETEIVGIKSAFYDQFIEEPFK